MSWQIGRILTLQNWPKVPWKGRENETFSILPYPNIPDFSVVSLYITLYTFENSQMTAKVYQGLRYYKLNKSLRFWLSHWICALLNQHRFKNYTKTTHQSLYMMLFPSRKKKLVRCMLTQNGSASGVHIINCRSSGYRLLHMVSHSQYLDSFHITNTADDLFPVFQGLVHFWYILTFHKQIAQTNRMFMFQYFLPACRTNNG